jgi:hypothetical protein
MLRNNKGFSVVELLAIIVITSLVIWPLTATLVKNIEINYRFHDRRSAASIADGTMYGLDKLDFLDLDAKVDAANGLGTYYIELNQDTCSTLDTAEDIALCDQIFAAIWNNLTLDSTQYKVIIYDYNLPQASIDSLYGNAAIPYEVREEINTITASTDANPSLLRITVWIQYYEDPVGVVILSGLLFND